ncbi:unnamed protein product [Notodromas monacha]|uniref:Uncharacterized protein n=1 Tax=Notodromas monacha TaxID=399045 RepID=A0A7R9BGV6_9CRUS|nr:unnamed protein product [Notodromas monacha]CAG0915079.1 unnamed protein product [Notodromas monacha]
MTKNMVLVALLAQLFCQLGFSYDDEEPTIPPDDGQDNAMPLMCYSGMFDFQKGTFCLIRKLCPNLPRDNSAITPACSLSFITSIPKQPPVETRPVVRQLVVWECSQKKNRVLYAEYQLENSGKSIAGVDFARLTSYCYTSLCNNKAFNVTFDGQLAIPR